MAEPTREEIFEILEDARKRRKNREKHVRATLAERYTELVTKVVRRGAHSYNYIDLIVGDFESYG